jgi:hypothetical protein
MLYRSVTVLVLAVLAGPIPAGALAQTQGLAPVLNPLIGPTGLGNGSVTVDLSGKLHPSAAVQGSPHASRALGRHGGPPVLDVVPPRLEGEARVRGPANGTTLNASGPLAHGIGAAGSAKGGSQSKADTHHLPTCD